VREEPGFIGLSVAIEVLSPNRNAPAKIKHNAIFLTLSGEYSPESYLLI
jgi:hypothetical protein